MRILMLGDVVGKPGRRAVEQLLPELRQELAVDVVVANGENAAGGIGLTAPTAQELLDAGADVITSGNHIWHHKEMIPHLEDEELPVVRPLNYPPGVPGRGFIKKDGLLVVNLLGRTFIDNFDDPFRAMDALLDSQPPGPRAVLVDFHAEATSEKMALGWYLDGRVSAVIGTHTHVGTVDARLLPQGTAYVTDVGMVGPRDSVIGDDPEAVIQRFLTQLPNRLPVGQGPVSFNAVLIDVAPETGKAVGIERIDREVVLDGL